MTFVLGLTGSIGMGKSTAAQIFAEAGVPVWDADEAVHRLYERGGAAVGPLSSAFPEAVKDGAVSRSELKAILTRDPSALAQLESIVHPLTARDRADFLVAHGDAPLVLLDIPLLFETGAQVICDKVAVVSVPAEIQRQRVLARAGMTEDALALILSRQMPDAEKRARADYVIDSRTMTGARAAIRQIVAELTGGNGHA